MCVAGRDDLDQVQLKQLPTGWAALLHSVALSMQACRKKSEGEELFLVSRSVGSGMETQSSLCIPSPPWVYTTERIGLPLPETCSLLTTPGTSKFITLSSVSARWPVRRSSQGFSRIHHVSCLHIVQTANMMPGISFQSVFGANLLNRHAANILACDCKKWPESRCIFIHATRHKKCFSFLLFPGPKSISFKS